MKIVPVVFNVCKHLLYMNIYIMQLYCGRFLCYVGRASLYNLVNETNLVHDLFLAYFGYFIYNLYMFRTSPRPLGGTKLFMRHLVLVILYI